MSYRSILRSNIKFFDAKFSDKVPDFYISTFKFIYISFLILGLLSYLSGYQIFFYSYILTKELNIIFSSTNHFTYTFYALITSLFISAILPNQKYTLIISLALYYVIQINISPYLNEYTTNMSFFILLLFLLEKKTSWSFKKTTTVSILYYSWLILCICYLGASISKITLSNSLWSNGLLLKKHITYNYHITNNHYLSYLLKYSSHNIIKAISLLVIIFESTFIISFFKNKLILFFLIVGSIFHYLTLLLFEINFFVFYYPTYFAGIYLLVLKKFSIIKPGKSKKYHGN